MMRWLTGESHERWIVCRLYHGIEERLRWLRCLWRQPQEVPGYSSSMVPVACDTYVVQLADTGSLLVGCFIPLFARPRIANRLLWVR